MFFQDMVALFSTPDHETIHGPFHVPFLRVHTEELSARLGDLLQSGILDALSHKAFK